MSRKPKATGPETAAFTGCLRFTVLGTPRTKKNSQQIFVNAQTGRRFITPSNAYKEYESDFLWQVPEEARQAIGSPVNVKCVYYMPTERRVDLLNLEGATCDILIKAGVLKDDNSKIVVSHDGSRVLVDRENPRVEIEISGGN